MAWKTNTVTVPETFESEIAMLKWCVEQFTAYFGTRGFIFIDHGEAERILAAFWKLRPEGLNASTKERKDDSK